ncbi:hypothetical protein OHA02_51045 [Streptomyces phaeochromogenes]|nr:hypothetical protein [Streptomyces phaeochromogenes]
MGCGTAVPGYRPKNRKPKQERIANFGYMVDLSESSMSDMLSQPRLPWRFWA